MLNKLASTNYKITAIFYGIVSIYYKERKVRMFMRFKVIAFGENKDHLLNPIIGAPIVIGKNNYVMRYAYDKAQTDKIRDFSLLERAMKGGESYRLIHTEYMLQSLILLTKNSEVTAEAAYEMFIEGRGNTREHYLSFEQFVEFRNFARETLTDPKDFKYLEYLLATHDIGCIYGEARHFVRSGDMSKVIFKELGYSVAQSEMARLINGNHSLLGDILLGEGTPDYAIGIYNELSRLSVEMGKSSDFGWRLLFILNVLDVHSAYNGFLTVEKMKELNLLIGIDEMIRLDKDWINLRKPLLGFTNAEFVPEFKNLYLQYCYDRLQHMKPEAAVWLLNALAKLDNSFKYSVIKVKDPVSNTDVAVKAFCITFKSGKHHNLDKMHEITKGNLTITYNIDQMTHQGEDGNIILLEGNFCGLPFTVTSDGYLEIDDVSEVK